MSQEAKASFEDGQDNPGVLLVDSDTFHHCAGVDGLRLEGAWTSYMNPNDPALDQLPQGQRPIFHFSRDGRFVDDGMFAVFLTPHMPAGSGNYDVKDFTITLRYSDGRVRQAAITGMLGRNPAKNSDLLFIARSQFNKRK